ncbi:hypothetical protein IHE55_12285 [Streptomyces pactum]|uniref:3-hydroxyacyl-ACP dehydratase n=1 Tax=Streptomyces pactum TaxID=68249 RepID=A0ABS0NK10_9ACTN|nr:hypothetical protein [Streptomyces pactum]MBH5335535.1 hypothetical protein [Streptomyces pactum]
MSVRVARPLDAVDALEVREDGPDLLVTARKKVCADDPYMPGHFPGHIVYPAVFLVETVRQAVGLACERSHGRWAELAGVRQARFARPLLAGDEAVFEITVSPAGDGIWTARARVSCAGEAAAELSVECAAVPREGDEDAGA